jgi:predicted HTH transcriptional regulator
VAHADYSLNGICIRVAIYANRLEVENPGMLPFDMTLEDLKAGVSRIRSRVLARLLRELGLVDEWGTGYRRVTQACVEGGYPPPVWQELNSALRVIFEPHPEAAGEEHERSDVPVNEPENEPINTRQQWFIAQIIAERQPGWVDLAQHWQVSRATAGRDITKPFAATSGARATSCAVTTTWAGWPCTRSPQ